MQDRKINVLWSAILEYHKKDSAVALGPHSHNFFHCFYVVDGCGRMVLDGNEMPLRKGCFYITPPGKTHEFSSSGHGKMILLEIKFELADKELSTFLSRRAGEINVEETPVYSILKSTRRELYEKKEFYLDIIEHNMSEIFIHLRRCAKGKGAYEEVIFGDDKILKAVLYMHAHLEDEITLDELANEVFLEKTYFLKRFKSVVGFTPMKYARLIKMDKAKELLTYSDKNITQISDMLGFKSVHHFSNSFSRDVGVSPTVYKVLNRI